MTYRNDTPASERTVAIILTDVEVEMLREASALWSRTTGAEAMTLADYRIELCEFTTDWLACTVDALNDSNFATIETIERAVAIAARRLIERSGTLPGVREVALGALVELNVEMIQRRAREAHANNTNA